MVPGDVVADRFRIEAVAGSGGMGTVYRATDLATDGATVALKMLSAVGERDALRFAREAAVLAELAHPGIVRLLAYGAGSDGTPYLAMEWVEGDTLQVRLARGRLPIGDAVALCRTIADAVGAAHARGVVHRDLKPGNLILAGGELARVKVLDFGIARRIDNHERLTHTGMVVGTPGYMAPEQVRGERDLDARVDVFALGCILYRCLTGHPAFGGDESLAVLAKILVDEVAPPSQLVPAIPGAIDAIVLRMLAKPPAARLRDGCEVAAALDAVAEVTVREAANAATMLVPAVSTQSSTAPRIAVTAAEQRLVSVVLARPLADAVIDRDRASSIAASFAGRLEQVSDGATLVLFAHAEVAGDHAVRAARCALALRELCGGGVGIVVATGRASLAAGSALASGAVIDGAVAAMQRAPGGKVVIDDATAGLLDPRFSVDTAGAGGMRRLHGLREAHRDDHRDAGEPQRTVLGRATPLVGRDRELGTLELLWRECTDERVARVALVIAPPGGGKSRLRQELVRRVLQRDERAELLVGRADSLGAGSPFAMLADAIRRAAGVREGDAIDQQRAALHARVARHVPAREADHVAHLLGEIAGVAFPSEASPALRAARVDPMMRGDAMREAWIAWLAAETADHPTLLVLEDLHWGDRSTVDLVDAALRELAHTPLMVVALARPEVHDLFPRLWTERDLQILRLPELTKKASERLVRDLLGATVAADTVQRIVERSAGNAFFLEELIRAVAEGRGEELPDSVLSILQLRLDALGPEARRVLRAASVFGETFWRGGVARLTDADPRAQLEQLVERELVSSVPRSRLPGEVEYTFRHDLVREAAYATTNAVDRSLAHELAGDWLVEHGHLDAVELAVHFSRGGAQRRAAELYASAAEQALGGHDYASALSLVERGLDCLARHAAEATLATVATRPATPAPDGMERAIAARLHLARAEAHNWRGEHSLAIAAAEDARSRLAPGQRSWFRAADEQFYGAGRLGDIPRAITTLRDLTATPPERDAEIAQLRSVSRAAIVMLRFGPPGIGPTLAARVEELAAQLEVDIDTEHRLHTVRGFVARSCGDAERCLREYRDAIANCEEAHNLRELAFCSLAYGGALIELGRHDLGEQELRRGIQVAERIGVLTVSALLRFSLALIEVETGRLEAAQASATRAITLCGEADRAAEGLARWVLAQAAYGLGDLASARSELARALDKLVHFPEWHALAFATHARYAAAAGELDEALRTVARARASMRTTEGFEIGESGVRLVEIEVFEAAGDLRVRDAIAEAALRLELRASRIQEPWRASFLDRPENRAILARRP